MLGDVSRGLINTVVIQPASQVVANGKEARGAASTDGYRFGDFTRGPISKSPQVSNENCHAPRMDFETCAYEAAMTASFEVQTDEGWIHYDERTSYGIAE